MQFSAKHVPESTVRASDLIELYKEKSEDRNPLGEL